jgi:hypothetical protein
MIYNEEIPPILGLVINDGVNTPFAEIYYPMFEEWYDVE